MRSWVACVIMIMYAFISPLDVVIVKTASIRRGHGWRVVVKPHALRWW